MCRKADKLVSRGVSRGVSRTSFASSSSHTTRLVKYRNLSLPGDIVVRTVLFVGSCRKDILCEM